MTALDLNLVPPTTRLGLVDGALRAADGATLDRVEVAGGSGIEAASDLQSHGMGSLFGSRSWIEALSATYGVQVQASILQRGGSTTAAILFCEIDDLRGRRVISLPFSDYVDPLVDDEEDWNRLVAPLLDKGVPVRFRSLRSAVPLTDRRFTRSGTALWHATDLTRPEDEIWSGLQNSARQNIRKAQRHGVVVRQGRTLDDLRIFYRMHCHVRKSKYRLFAQPFSFFENLHAAFAPDDRIFVVLAEIDGAAVGGILFLVHGDTLYYKFNASTEAILRPNDLLVWTGMQLGRARGLSRLDFGLSDPGQPGLVRFKQKFATEERTISLLQSIPPGYADERAEAAGRVLQRLTAILTSSETPDDVTLAVGDELYRYFC
jgi:CelD/BcsL family acetyltransferase involved in cellulose biosynthesis